MTLTKRIFLYKINLYKSSFQSDEVFSVEANKLQELLRSNLDSMPAKARRVVEYLLTHMREAAFISIGDVADTLGVSKAQLVRVARILGFKGYAELKSALKESVLEQVNPAAMLARAMSEEGTAVMVSMRLEKKGTTWVPSSTMAPASPLRIAAMSDS